MNQNPVLQILVGAFLISFSAVFVAFSQVAPTTSAFYRVFFGSIFLAVCIFTSPSPKRIHSATRPFWLLLTCCCGFAFALDLFFWHKSIHYIGPGLATLLGNFQVFFLTLIGLLFFKEKVRKRFIVSIPLAMLGLFFVIDRNWGQLESNYKLGIAYGLLTAICYTAYILLLRKLQHGDRDSRFFPIFTVSLFSSFFLMVKMLVTGDSFAIPGAQSLLSLLGLGLISQCIGWMLIAGALPRLRPSLAGLILLLQPALSFIWDVLLFGKQTTLVNWSGLLITLAAIYMGVSNDRREK